jgi:hypothetical protein
MPDVPVTVVGYAVAHTNDSGQTQSRLVTSMHDLATLRLDEEAQLTDGDIEPLQQALEAMAHEEHQKTLVVSQIEAINQAAGRSQELLDYLVIRGIIQSRQHTGGAEPLIWSEITALDDLFRDKDRLRVRRIPSVQAHNLSGLLFDLTIPNTGDESYLDAPHPLLIASLDAAFRLVAAMKVRRAELSTDDFLARLDREIARIAQSCQ